MDYCRQMFTLCKVDNMVRVSLQECNQQAYIYSNMYIQDKTPDSSLQNKATAPGTLQKKTLLT